MSEEKMRTSYIEKTLEIKANIGDFSTVTASVKFGENIDWKTSEERAKKLESVSKNLRKELKKDFDTFLKENGMRARTQIMLDNKMKTSYED
jgi:formylmethanofuran dehydrogenase subunit C